MRVRTLLKILAGLVIAVVAAVIVAVLVIDPNAYKDDIVAAVEKETGRSFSIDSDIDLRIGFTTSVAVGGVRLSNAEWGSQPDMVKVGEFAVELALIPLIFGGLQINRLILRDTDILIESDAQGRSNLEFEQGATTKAEGGGTAKLPRIDDVLIEDAVITVIDGAQGAPREFKLKRLSASLKGDADNIAIENVVLALERSEIRGSATVESLSQRPRATATLQAERLDLTELLSQQVEGGDAPAAERSEQAKKSDQPTKIFPSDPLPLDTLNAFDAKLDFEFGELVAPGATLSDAKGTLALEGGSLAFQPFDAKLKDDPISADMSVDTNTGPAVVKLELKAPQLDMGALLRDYAGLDNLRGKGSIDISLQGTGHSVAEIMASLDGHTRLVMDKGEMKNQFLGNISGLGKTIGEAFGKKEWIIVECIASDFEIAGGIANSAVNVINTELLLITAKGKIDLGEEKLNLTVTPRPKGIDLSLAVPVNIGGTLASPTFTPNPVGTVKKVGQLLGTAVFPPAAVSGLTGMRGDNPCVQRVHEVSQQQQDQPSSSAETETEKTKGPLESLGEGIKKLFGD